MLELLDNNNITNYEFIDAINGSDAKYDDIFSNKQHISMWEKKNKKKHITQQIIFMFYFIIAKHIFGIHSI